MTATQLKEQLRLIGKSLTHAAEAGDWAAVNKWAKKALALTAADAPTVPPKEPPKDPPKALDVPNFGPSNKLSGGLYEDWVAAWFAANNLNVAEFADVIAQAKKDGCLAQVCATGRLDTPYGANAATGDWSLYTGYPQTDGVTRVYIMGKLVAEGGGGWELAQANGVES